MSAFEKSLSERLIRVEVAHEKKLGAILPREDIANFDDAVEHIASFPLPHPAEVAPDRWELDDAVDLISHQPQQAVQTLAQNLRICLRKDVKQELLENGIDPKEVDEIIKTGMQKVDQCTHEFSEAQRKPKAKPKPIIDEDADQWKQAAMMDEKTGESASWVDREENRSPTSIGNDIY